MTHELKILPQYFKDVMLGLKKFEIRFNDRNYQVGDTLILNEFNPTTKKYTGFQVIRKVDYILKNEIIITADLTQLSDSSYFIFPVIKIKGLEANYVILQISKLL
ncbi:ASCH domain protein (modular protein) [Flavobacterium psychrophilum]|uniref:DUF3850 domain-containing protein n=1 Tax=Flavobacterium psychrophilum TaxID=96345 RepID=UPI000B7C2FEB|nr:DUF3850 domain-containing protein [Flavobacterium psychrophilum]SNA83259.1 ASCH domain protein (modular protein) [Flavobacterium psychrophilum]